LPTPTASLRRGWPVRLWLGEPFVPFGYAEARTDVGSDTAVLSWIERHFSWDQERTDPGGVDWYGPNRYCGDDSDFTVVRLDDDPGASRCDGDDEADE